MENQNSGYKRKRSDSVSSSNSSEREREREGEGKSRSVTPYSRSISPSKSYSRSPSPSLSPVRKSRRIMEKSPPIFQNQVQHHHHQQDQDQDQEQDKEQVKNQEEEEEEGNNEYSPPNNQFYSTTSSSSKKPFFSLYISEIARGVSDEELLKELKKIGNIYDVSIIKNNFTNETRGFGYAKIDDEDELNSILSIPQENLPYFLDKYSHKSQNIKISVAYSKNVVYLGSIPVEVSDHDILDIINKRTQIMNSDFRMFIDWSVTEKFGYISYDSHILAKRAIKFLRGMTIKGKKVVVTFADNNVMDIFSGKNTENLEHVFSPEVFQSKKVLIVDNISSNTLPSDIQKLYGGSSIDKIDLPMSDDNKNMGFGYIFYKTHQDAKEIAIKNKSIHFNGKRMKITWCIPPHESIEFKRKFEKRVEQQEGYYKKIQKLSKWEDKGFLPPVEQYTPVFRGSPHSGRGGRGGMMMRGGRFRGRGGYRGGMMMREDPMYREGPPWNNHSTPPKHNHFHNNNNNFQPQNDDFNFNLFSLQDFVFKSTEKTIKIFKDNDNEKFPKTEKDWDKFKNVIYDVVSENYDLKKKNNNSSFQKRQRSKSKSIPRDKDKEREREKKRSKSRERRRRSRSRSKHGREKYHSKYNQYQKSRSISPRGGGRHKYNKYSSNSGHSHHYRKYPQEKRY